MKSYVKFRWFMFFGFACCFLCSAVIASDDNPKTDDKNGIDVKDSGLPELPRPLTSFGAILANDHIFVCGGHSGDAHSYSKNEQSDELLVLDLKTPKAWQSFKIGQNIQGLGLVAYRDEVIRVGGFTARNEEGQDQVLESLTEVASFDVKTGKWTSLPSLPSPRSSHDAVVIGDQLYVVGGWQLDPNGGKQKWHSEMNVMDLSKPNRAWTTVSVPFQRRALAVLEFQGKMFAVGGMTSDGAPSTAVHIFDPKANTWEEGPAIPGKGMEGFGIGAGVVDGELVATTISGNALRFDPKARQWQAIGTTPTARFFHRLLPHGHSILVVGGGNMEIGKFQNVELMTLKTSKQ